MPSVTPCVLPSVAPPRYTQFAQLANFITSQEEQRELYPNSLFSWQCLIHRKRWFRCLDREYLKLKCFLLERFLHDLVYESSDASFLYDFIGV